MKSIVLDPVFMVVELLVELLPLSLERWFCLSVSSFVCLCDIFVLSASHLTAPFRDPYCDRPRLLTTCEIGVAVHVELPLRLPPVLVDEPGRATALSPSGVRCIATPQL